jgi:hypothetical protein
MIPRRKANKALLKQRLLVKTGLQLRHIAHRKVDIASFEPTRAVLRNTLRVDGNAGCELTHLVND